MGLGVARGGVAAGQPRSAREEKITPFIASLIMGLGVGMRWGGGTASCSLADMRGVGVTWSACMGLARRLGRQSVWPQGYLYLYLYVYLYLYLNLYLNLYLYLYLYSCILLTVSVVYDKAMGDRQTRAESQFSSYVSTFHVRMSRLGLVSPCSSRPNARGCVRAAHKPRSDMARHLLTSSTLRCVRRRLERAAAHERLCSPIQLHVGPPPPSLASLSRLLTALSRVV